MNLNRAIFPICAVIFALIVVHGFGRFVYTPLIPLFIQDGLLTLNQAAQLATWNYIGYLTGALASLFAWQNGLGRSTLLISLIGNALITCLQILGDSYLFLAMMRLFNGISNGIVFVLAPALVLEWLIKHQKGHLSGLMYLGVGIGLLLSSLLVELTQDWFADSWRWLPAAVMALPLALLAGFYLFSLGATEQPVIKDDHSPLWDKQSTPLFLSYAGAGLGYILPMTFLPALAHSWALEIHPSPWLVAATASIPAIFIWGYLGEKLGERNSLLINYSVQCAAIASILLFPASALGLWLCAGLMGGSFLGAVFLTQRLARNIHPHQGPRLSAALIAIYGIAQLIGPIIAEVGINLGATLASAFVWGLGACIWALLLMLKVPNIKSGQ